jgi:hypothetical protein
MTSQHWCHVMIQCAVLTVHDGPPLILCYNPVSSAYMTSHHWCHVMIECVVLTVHDEPPLMPRHDPVCSAYITWRATTDPMLWPSVQCLQYMTSHHWPHVIIQCKVLTLHDEPPLILCYDPVCSAYSTWWATTDPMLWSSVQCYQ